LLGSTCVMLFQPGAKSRRRFKEDGLFIPHDFRNIAELDEAANHCRIAAGRRNTPAPAPEAQQQCTIANLSPVRRGRLGGFHPVTVLWIFSRLVPEAQSERGRWRKPPGPDGSTIKLPRQGQRNQHFKRNPGCRSNRNRPAPDVRRRQRGR
jgi:hypothetical protein